ncbi:MAG: hypothetical protein IAE91_09905 [Ignavibacteriaceae bacterium]|nr:hypothetical protein [Ignavibacteriaceae bacterium]
MAAQKPEFILIPKNLKERDFELSGREAIDLAFLVRENIPIPSSFIISTLAFDEFLVENNLVAPIAKELKKVRPFIKKTAVEASAEIKKLIMDSELPNKLSLELEHAYKKLSENNENPIVTLIISNIIEEKYVPTQNVNTGEVLLQGIKDLEYQLKIAWSKLFSDEAIEFRANGYYKGEISVGIIIQKLIRAEVSGLTNSSTLFNKNEIETKAVYGIDNEEFEEHCDSYIVDAKSFRILNTHIIPQDYMFIHDLKTNSKSNFIKVDLSPTWKKNSKLDEDSIIYISKVTKKIQGLFKQEVSVRWGIEAGEIYILSLDPLVFPKVEEKAVKDKKKEENNSKKEKVGNEPDIEKLAEEVIDIVAGKEDVPVIEEVKTEQENVNENVTFPDLKNDKSPEDEKLKYIDEFMFESGVFLDISKMNSKHLSALQYFSGSFFDGTEMLLNNNILPEEYSQNKQVLLNLVEKYSLDLTTAARCEIHKPIIYQLSSISALELKLLGLNENKYKYNLDERFIDYPESLGVEVMAIKKSKVTHNSRNINISIPALRNLSNLDDIEKVFASSGLKRSSTFRIYAEVSIPSFIFELDRIGRNRIDGIIVNYSKLLRALTFRNEIREVDNLIGEKMLELLKTIAKEKNLEFIVRLNSYNMNLVKFIHKLKPQEIIFTNIPSEETLKLLSS